jgi:hypothetical protein
VSAAAKKVRKRSVETDALCAECGPYDDLFEMYGALTIDYVDDRPTTVWFDPWDDTIASVELDVKRFMQTEHQTRVTCEEGHEWKFEAVEDDDDDDDDDE